MLDRICVIIKNFYVSIRNKRKEKCIVFSCCGGLTHEHNSFSTTEGFGSTSKQTFASWLRVAIVSMLMHFFCD